MQINTSQDIYLPSLFTFDFFIPVQFASRPFDLFCVLINSKLTCPEFLTTSDLLGQQPSCTILISDRFIVYNYGPIFRVLYLFSSGTSKIICCIKIVIILQKKKKSMASYVNVPMVANYLDWILIRTRSKSDWQYFFYFLRVSIDVCKQPRLKSYRPATVVGKCFVWAPVWQRWARLNKAWLADDLHTLAARWRRPEGTLAHVYTT